MKESEIHNNLPHKELRDFISLSLVKNFQKDCDNQKERVGPIKDNPVEWAIKDCESEIAFYQRKLELRKELLALTQIMKMNNWREFDVSDQVSRDSGLKLILSFIGTEKEANELELKISHEKK